MIFRLALNSAVPRYAARPGGVFVENTLLRSTSAASEALTTTASVNF